MLKILRVFYSFLIGKKFVFILMLTVVSAASIVGSLSPYFYKLFVDAIPQLDYPVLFRILIFYILARLLTTSLYTIAHYLGDVILVDAAAEARTKVFKILHDLDFAFHSSKSTGSLISAIKRGDGAFFGLFHVIHFRILDIFVGMLVMVYFFSGIDWKIAAFVVLSFAISLPISRVTVGINFRARKRFLEEEDNISGVITDNIIGFETVKLFSKEDWELRNLSKKFEDWKHMLWKFAHTYRIFDVSTALIMNISIFLIMLITLNLATNLKLTVGEFVLIIGFITSFYPRLFDLVWGIRDIAKDYADIEKYLKILGYKILIQDPKNPVKLESVAGEIEFADVSFKYEKDEKEAVKNINLRVRQGQSVAFVGSSGAGKTTMVKLLMRFFDVDEGKIAIDGVNIKNFTKSDLRSFMGVVPQEPILFNNTIGYNIAYGKEKAGKKEIIAAAKLANIHDFIVGLPKKYETQVGERGIKLSGGQKQRVAIARMILSDPEIIIFDEATSQLDSESERLIQDAFWKASKNKTTIIIAHRLSTVSRTDKIVVMENGRIVETGSHTELLRFKNGKYRHFLDLQTDIN